MKKVITGIVLPLAILAIATCVVKGFSAWSMRPVPVATSTKCDKRKALKPLEEPYEPPGTIEQIEEPEETAFFTEEEVVMVAKTVWGEAGCSWISREDKAKVAWTICNRVNDNRWPNTVAEVVAQPYQFHGYSVENPVTEECYDIALDVLTRWSQEKQGATVYREAAPNITAFYGDGYLNYFYVY